MTVNENFTEMHQEEKMVPHARVDDQDVVINAKLVGQEATSEYSCDSDDHKSHDMMMLTKKSHFISVVLARKTVEGKIITKEACSR